jgi:FkbM family methyltransferase
MSAFDLAQLIVLHEKTGFFEWLVTKLYKNLIFSGDTCIDAGAHRGIHTFPMAHQVGLKGRVMAFEPIPSFAQRLRAIANDGFFENVEIFQCALSNEIGTSEFCHVMNAPGWSGLRPRAKWDKPVETSTIRVNLVTLDSILQDRPCGRLKFYKLDIEGAEFHALRGSKNTLLRWRPFLVFENGYNMVARQYGYTRDEWFRFFDDIGYAVRDLYGGEYDRREWPRPHQPWYTLAFPADGEYEPWVRNIWPVLVSDTVARAREVLSAVHREPPDVTAPAPATWESGVPWR